MNNVDIVYTLWSNLRKTQGMDVGQVGFHKEKEVSKTVHSAKHFFYLYLTTYNYFLYISFI